MSLISAFKTHVLEGWRHWAACGKSLLSVIYRITIDLRAVVDNEKLSLNPKWEVGHCPL